MKRLAIMAGAACVLAASITLHAQDISQNGTFFLQSYGTNSPPFPYNPYGDLEDVVVLDATSHIYEVLDSPGDYADLQSLNSMSRMSMMDGIDPGGGGDGTNGLFSDSFDYVPPTNGLYLTLENVSGGLTYATLHGGSNMVYAVRVSTNIALPLNEWPVQMELWPVGGQTNALPFTISSGNGESLFLNTEDWSDAWLNGLPCWWTWLYFGDAYLSETATNLDGNGNTLGDDYTNDVPPAVFQFTAVEVTNDYFSSSSAASQLDVTGSPYYIAISLDDTNFANDSDWQIYDSTNVTVNLGATEGWHDVWIGLRGHGDDPTNGVWQCKRLDLDLTAPLLIITNPAATTVSVPLVQIQGYSPEELSGISYDLSNALVVITNQNAGISDEFFDTNSWEFTTNYFECVDVPLTNGLNIITLHATDEAGNVTVTNISITLDGSSRTNPPVVQLYWPQDGTLICNSNYTWRGWVDDPTATVNAQLVDTNGNTNIFDGIVERDGHFWIENLPMGGTNVLTLTATDWMGNVAVTNITVYPGAVALTIDAPTSDELWSNDMTVSGTIGEPDDYTVWVNGVKATNNEDGTWEADDVPNTAGGTSVIQARAIPDTDNGGNGSGGGGTVGYDNPGNPDSAQAQDEDSQTNKPSRIYMKSYTQSVVEHSDMSDMNWDAEGDVTDSIEKNRDISSSLNWNDENGGSGFDSDRMEQSGMGIDHTVIEDDYTSVFPAYGAGTTVFDWTDTDFDNPDEDDSGIESYEDTPLLLNEYCKLQGRLNSNISASGSWGGYQSTVHVTFDRNAQTVYELETGGKGKSDRENLFELGAGAEWGTLLLLPGREEESPWNYAADVPVDATQISIMGKNEDTNGNVYVLLADNKTFIVTPQVKGKDYYTMDKPGQTKYTLTHQTEHPALTNTNRDRTTIGVGEEVDLSGMPANTIWNTSGGGLSATNGTGVIFTAPSNAANATVTATVGGQSLQTSFSVVEPSGYDHAQIIETDHFSTNEAGAGMVNAIWIAPTAVSFYKVQMLEVGEPATNTIGYFTNFPADSLNHHLHGADTWFPLTENNEWWDHAAGGPLPNLPWSSGSFNWNVPAQWKVGDNGTTNTIGGWIQSFSIDGNGTVTIQKFGNHVTRDTNDVINTN